MLENWMCDGYPNGNDSDNYDVEAYRSEALRFQRIADARVAKLLSKPNAQNQGLAPQGEPDGK